MNEQIELTVRAKAFSFEGVRTHRVLVEGQAVRVFDPVAGCFTSCHSLSRGAQRRITKLARQTTA